MKINPGNARGLLVPQGDRPFSFVVYSSEIRDFGLLVSLNIKRTTLYEWIQKKHLPPPFEKCGKDNHWTVGQIREWRAARALAKTAAAQQQMVEECRAERHYHNLVMNSLNSDLDL